MFYVHANCVIEWELNFKPMMVTKVGNRTSKRRWYVEWKSIVSASKRNIVIDDATSLYDKMKELVLDNQTFFSRIKSIFSDTQEKKYVMKTLLTTELMFNYIEELEVNLAL